MELGTAVFWTIEKVNLRSRTFGGNKVYPYWLHYSLAPYKASSGFPCSSISSFAPLPSGRMQLTDVTRLYILSIFTVIRSVNLVAARWRWRRSICRQRRRRQGQTRTGMRWELSTRLAWAKHRLQYFLLLDRGSAIYCLDEFQHN